MSHKMAALERFFVKLLKTPLLIADKGAVSGLRWFLATENPWKLTKNAFYFILKPRFALKYLSWLFGHAEQTVWLERLR